MQEDKMNTLNAQNLCSETGKIILLSKWSHKENNTFEIEVQNEASKLYQV